MDSTLAVLSTVRCLSFLPRGAPSSLGTVDEDREAGDGPNQSSISCSAIVPHALLFLKLQCAANDLLHRGMLTATHMCQTRASEHAIRPQDRVSAALMQCVEH